MSTWSRRGPGPGGSAPGLHCVVLIALACGVMACGKKGPPLAPIVPIPAAVERATAERVGDAVYVTVTIPRANVDRSMPVDIGRIDVYGYTGRVAPRTRVLEVATLVGSVPVAGSPSARDQAPTVPTAPTAPSGSVQAAPGPTVTVVDALTPEKLLPGPTLPEPVGRRRGGPGDVPASPPGEVAPLRRFYYALPFSTRNRPGPPMMNPVEVALTNPPDPPDRPELTFDASQVTLRWEPSGGVIGFLLASSGSFEPPPDEDDGQTPAAALSTASLGPIRYNVYRAVPLQPPAAEAVAVSRPMPVNDMPSAATQLAQPAEFDTEQCYTVRAVRGTAPDVVESAASEPACIMPVDIFPPAAPSNLVALGVEGAINLIWEANREPDLGGYLVLRGAPGDATLQPLTSMPVTETRFSDTTVAQGMRYVYAVVAVDTQPEPNVSPESDRVEETAR